MEKEVTKYRMLTGSSKAVSALLIMLLSNCSSNTEKSNATSKNRTRDSAQVHPASSNRRLLSSADTATFLVIPDTTINGKLILSDYTSTKKFYPGIESTHLVEHIRSSPVAAFCNSGKDQYLLSYAYEGRAKKTFSLFEIGYVRDLDSAGIKAMVSTHEESFKTESGLTLGLTTEDIVKIKGAGFETATSENEKTLTYRISSLNNSPFLQRHHTPGYFIQLSLKKERVAKIIFGFEYP